MLQPGEYICPQCGARSNITYYRSGQLRGGIVLTHFTNLTNHSTKYYLQPDAEFLDSVQVDSPDDIELASTPNGVAGIPMSITIQVRQGDNFRQYTLKRFCPNCGKYGKSPYQLLPNYGCYPTFVLAMVGPTSAGKTSYLRALQHPDNHSCLESADFPLTFHYYQFSHDTVDSQATPLDSLGKTIYIELIRRDTDETIAGILLLDTPGELYQRSDSNASLSDHVLQGLLQDDSVDGFFLFHSLISTDTTQADSLLEFLAERHLPGKTPAAYICTCLDRYLANANKIQQITCTDGTSMQLFSPATFSNGKSYRAKELLTRVCMENYITSQLDNSIKSSLPADVNGFLVQSCDSNDRMIKNQEEIDFSATRNLYDPLIWILNKLQIFPLSDSEANYD